LAREVWCNGVRFSDLCTGTLPAEKLLLQVSPYDLSKGRMNFRRSYNAELISAFFVSMNHASYESATLS
jgi:hypothetical protein